MSTKNRVISPDNIIRYLFVFILFINLATYLSTLFSVKNVNGVESNVVYAVEQIVDDNSNLYTDVKEIPHAITQYAPLYYMVSDALISALPVSLTKKSYAIRIILRILSSLFFVLILIYAYRIVTVINASKPDKREKKLLFLLLFSLVMPWFFITRPDVLVTLFFLIGTYYLILSEEGKKYQFILLAGLFSALALFSKQNGLLLFLIVSSYLVLRLRIKALFAYTGSYVACLTLLCLFYYVLGYPAMNLYENLVIGVSNGIDLKNATVVIKTFIALFGFPFCILIYQVILNQKKLRNNFTSGYLVYVVATSLIFGLITCFKAGSAMNYFIEAIIFSVILGFTMVKNIKKELILIGLLYCLSISTYHCVKSVPRNLFYTLNSGYKNELNAVNKIIDAELGDGYFCTNMRPIILDNYDRAILPQYEIVMSSIGHHNPSSAYYQNLVKNIDYEKISLLIVDTRFRFPDIEFKDFQLYDKIGDIEVYKHTNLSSIIK